MPHAEGASHRERGVGEVGRSTALKSGTGEH